MNFPIYVISLAHATERRADISRRLDAAGVNHEIVDAVDGTKLNLDDCQPRLKQDLAIQAGRGELTCGEIGCFLSHYNLWEKMIANQIPFALILEDDATWDDDFFGCTKAIIESPYYWNIAHLASPKVGQVIATIDIIGKRRLVRYKSAQSIAAAYLIDLDGAKKMHKFCYQIRDSIDQQWKLYWLPNVYFYHIHPPVAINVNDVVSTIGDRRSKNLKHQQRKEGGGRFRYWLRANKKRYARRIYHWTHPRIKRK